MKAVLAAIALTMGTTVAVMNMTDAVHAGNGNSNSRWNDHGDYDDGWDTEGLRKCNRNKRKCVEVASNLAYRMAESGAYTDLDDNAFAAFAIKVASHIVDNDYSHDANEGPPAR